MTERTIFSYTNEATARVEISADRDINALRNFVRAGRFSDTDAALMKGVALAGYANRYNIERYMLAQTEYKVATKRYFPANVNKLVDAGFLVRLYVSYGDHTESPRIYAPSVASSALLPQLLGQKKAQFRSGLPLLPPVTILSKTSAFQCYVAMMTDPVFSGASLTLWPNVTVGKYVSTPALCAETSSSCLYVIVVRRQEEHQERALTDAEALFTHLSGSGRKGAILFLCEDVLHAQMVAAALPASLRLQPDATLFSYDAAMIEAENMISLFRAKAGSGSTTLTRTELSPMV